MAEAEGPEEKEVRDGGGSRGKGAAGPGQGWGSWVRGRLWMFSAWAAVRPLALFPSASSCRNRLLVVWVGAHCAGWRTG